MVPLTDDTHAVHLFRMILFIGSLRQQIATPAIKGAGVCTDFDWAATMRMTRIDWKLQLIGDFAPQELEDPFFQF